MWTGSWPSGNGQGLLRHTARQAIESTCWSRWPGLPDMVFAANGATVVDGHMLPARFASTATRGRGRSACGVASAKRHLVWRRDVPQAIAVNEAEGDFAVLSSRILAGYGFRTTPEAHRELATLTGREVISLELIDPRLFHLDLALAVLDDERDHIAYYPHAFSQRSRQLLADAVSRCAHCERA